MQHQLKNNKSIKPGLYNGFQKVMVPVFGVLSTMLLAHKALSKPEMGVWSLFLVVTSVVELFRQGLVKTSLIKYINHTKEDQHSAVMSAAFFLNAVVTVILCILLFFFSRQIALFLNAPLLESMLHIFIVGMLFLIPFSHFEWIMYGKSLFKNLFWTYLVRQGLTLSAIFVYYLIHGSITLQALVIIYSTGILSGALSGFAFVKRFLILRYIPSGVWINKLWQFGKYVFGSNVSTLVFRNVDQFMVSNVLSNTAFVASQSISLRIVNLADIPSQVMSDIVFPKSSNPELLGKPGVIKSYYEKAVGATLCFIVPIVIFILIFPKAILFILAGEKYYDAIPYLRLVSFSTIFLAFLKQWGVIIDSTGRPQLNFLIITIIAILEITLCYFFINAFGFLGAAYALLSTHFLGFVVTQLLLKKYFGINFINCFKYAIGYYPQLYQLFLHKFLSKWKTGVL
ncbi:MAG: oligosaccharide flippase family protein [Ginsengibacter sp.]